MRILRLVAVTIFTFFTTVCYAGPNEDLLAACRNGSLADATTAISAGADVNFLTDGNSPLAAAVLWPDITKLLLEKGADPNLGDMKPLYQASLSYSTEVVKMLLDAGADPNKPSLVGGPALFKTLIAAEKAKGKDGNQDYIKAWTSAMATAKPTESYVLPTVVYTSNCAACVEMLLAKGASMQKGVTDGTLLHMYGGSLVKSKEVWKQSFPQTKKNIDAFGVKLPEWFSADMPADRFGTAEEMLKILLSKGLKINEKNKGADGLGPRTPLELAFNSGYGTNTSVMLALINNGADVKIESEAFGPMILQAAQSGSVDVVKAMVEKGSDINADGRFFAQSDAQLKGFTPLIVAVMKDHLDLAKYLLGAGAKTDKAVEGKFMNEKTKCLSKVSDKTAIYFAVENGNMEMVKLLAESGGKWFDRIKIHEMKKKELGTDVMGQKVEVVSCFGAGEYIPSRYAKAVKLTEIEDYLKTKGL
jgi:ankyrin repeat protein